MAEHIPLVMIGGQLQQLPAGDTVSGAAGGGTTNNYVVPESSWLMSNAVGETMSSSAFAMKGNIVEALGTFTATGFYCHIGSSQDYRAVLCEVTQANNNDASDAIISAILYDSGEITSDANDDLQVNFTFPNGIDIIGGRRYIFALIRTDGDTTAAMAVPFNGAAVTNTEWRWIHPIRNEIDAISIGTVVAPQTQFTTPVKFTALSVMDQFLTAGLSGTNILITVAADQAAFDAASPLGNELVILNV